MMKPALAVMHVAPWMLARGLLYCMHQHKSCCKPPKACSLPDLIQILAAAVVAPLYFQGKIGFGVINQSSSAFNHILSDVSLVVYQVRSSVLYHCSFQYTSSTEAHSSTGQLTIASSYSDQMYSLMCVSTITVVPIKVHKHPLHTCILT